jgi:TonB family protein
MTVADKTRIFRGVSATAMLPFPILNVTPNAFQTSPDGRVCGRFRPEQLPPRPLLRQKLRRFLVALVLVCGLGLSGQEALAQVRKAHSIAPAVRKPTKAPIKNTTAVDGSAALEDIELIGGIMPLEVIETTNSTSPSSLADTTLKTNTAEQMSFGGVEQMPVFKGGQERLSRLLQKNMRRSSEAPQLQGKVFVGFTVDKEGHVRNAKVLRSLHPALDAEALRLVQLLDCEFTPGQQNHQPVDVKYALPITFTPR